ncbi:MAG: tRNA epoxyqueuosine(34) reductase QueG [Thermoanaerobaculia bacterium]
MRPAASRAPRRPPPPLPDDPAGLSRAAVESARVHGFAASGILASARSVSFDKYREWLAQGFHGEMAFLERDAAARMRFDAVLPFTRSVIAVARAIPARGPGNVAQVARGEDYHDVVRRHLKAVIEDLRPLAPRGAHFRVCVDTAPLLEREIAARAGLGFLGKNGLLIVPGLGSHVVLGEILTDVALAPTLAPSDPGADRCGTCTACFDECPTSAFVAPRVLDARKCVAYLTIEKRTPFTAAEEAALEGRLFGCDVCQDVCPFNEVRGARPTGPGASLDPAEIVALDASAFRARFFGSGVWRATHEGLVRNAAAALRRKGRA